MDLRLHLFRVSVIFVCVNSSTSRSIQRKGNAKTLQHLPAGIDQFVKDMGINKPFSKLCRADMLSLIRQISQKHKDGSENGLQDNKLKKEVADLREIVESCKARMAMTPIWHSRYRIY